jgi:hypothetical protein
MLEIGAWLWVVVGAGLWLATGPGAAFVMRARAFRRARRRRAALGAPVPPVGFVDGAPALLEGCLETRGKTIPRHGDDVPVAAASVVVDDGREGRVLVHEQAAGLSIATGGVSVELQGRLDLQAGSRERHLGLSARWVRRRLRARLPGTVREVEGAVVVRSVAPADRVRIAGSLRRVSAAEDVALYREAAARWRLVPAHEGGTLPVASTRRPRVSGPALLVWTRRSALALVAFAVLVVGGGEVAMQLRHYDLAALTPLRRAVALNALFERSLRQPLRYGLEPNPDLLQLALLPELRMRCAEAASALARLDFPEEAAHLGERCGTSAALEVAGGQWRILGDHARASGVFAAGGVATQASVQAHLASGSFTAATVALERQVPVGSTNCIATALRARDRGTADAAAARERLRGLAGSNAPATRLACGLLYADLLEGPHRTAFLESLPRAVQGTPWDELATLLAWEADPAREVPPSEMSLPIGATPSSLAYLYGPSLHVAPALEARVLDLLTYRTDAPALALRARLATSRATLEAIAGDTSAARWWLAEAVRLIEALPAYAAQPLDLSRARRDLAGLAAAIELRGGDPSNARAIADAQAPWQRANLGTAIQELGLLAEDDGLGSPPFPGASVERIFVRQGARLLESRFAGDGVTEELTETVRSHRAVLLARESAVPMAILGLAPPVLAAPAPAAPSGEYRDLDPGLMSPVVRRMHQIYALYGTPYTPFFPIGTLAMGGTGIFPVQVAAGECRTVVAVGGPGVRDLDLAVTTPDGVPFRDTTHEDLAVVRACSATAGSTRVELRMTEGSGAVALQSFHFRAR